MQVMSRIGVSVPFTIAADQGGLFGGTGDSQSAGAAREDVRPEHVKVSW
jgi:hypothetical protein